MSWLFAELPPLGLLIIGAATATALAAAAVQQPALATAAGSRIALVVILGAALVVGHALGMGASADRSKTRSDLLSSVPGLVLAAWASASLWWPLPKRVEWFLGGDHVRHLVFVAQERADGVLDYSTNEYPRAWHTLIATVWSATGAKQDAAGLLTLMSLLSMAVLLLHVLLSLSIGRLGASLGRRCGLGAVASGLAGLVAGSLTLWPSFLADYQILGFENSILAVVLLAVAAREVIEGASTTRCLVLTVAACAVMAHVWQLLLPATAGLAAAATVAFVRRNPRRRAAAAGVLTAGAAVAWPGVWAAVHLVGVNSAVNAGVNAPLPPIAVVVASLAATGQLAWVRRADQRVLAVTSMVAVTALGAVGVALWVGIPVTQYYPAKMVWTAVVLSLAPLGVVTVILAERVWGRVGKGATVGTAVRVVMGAASGLGIAFSFAAPGIAFVGPSATADGPETLGALTAPGAGQAQVVWLPRGTAEETRFDSTTTRLLLDFYAAAPGMQYRDQRSPSVGEECSELARAARPTVLSSAQVDEVRRRYSCVPDVVVVHARPYSS